MTASERLEIVSSQLKTPVQGTQVPSVQSSCGDPVEALVLERKRCRFNVRELTNLIYGNAERANVFGKVQEQLQRDPIFQGDYADKTTPESRRLCMARIKRLFEYKEIDDPLTFECRLMVISLLDPSAYVRQGVHVCNVIWSVGTIRR